MLDAAHFSDDVGFGVRADSRSYASVLPTAQSAALQIFTRRTETTYARRLL
jgi:hypothetical protein